MMYILVFLLLSHIFTARLDSRPQSHEKFNHQFLGQQSSRGSGQRDGRQRNPRYYKIATSKIKNKIIPRLQIFNFQVRAVVVAAAAEMEAEEKIGVTMKVLMMKKVEGVAAEPLWLKKPQTSRTKSNTIRKPIQSH
jgi:hypothetical protein